MGVQKENLHEYAYRAIIRMILDGAYRPGDFVLETELAGTLGLSRTPVSHALGRLVAEGFLERRPKKGCVIPRPRLEDAGRVFEARRAVEGELASLAATRATDEDLAALQQVVLQQRAVDDGHNKESYTLLNERFHLTIARASHNPYLERYCRHAFWRSNVYIFFFDGYYRTAQERPSLHLTPGQHAGVFEAIVARDRDRAGRLMAEHVESTLTGLCGNLSREHD